MADKKTILLVDDDVMQRRLYESHLTEAGFDVMLARNKAEALMFLRCRRDIALVITDGKMETEFGGVELIKEARVANVAIPMVLITSGGPRYQQALEAVTEAGDRNLFVDRSYLSKAPNYQIFHEQLIAVANNGLKAEAKAVVARPPVLTAPVREPTAQVPDMQPPKNVHVPEASDANVHGPKAPAPSSRHVEKLRKKVGAEDQMNLF